MLFTPDVGISDKAEKPRVAPPAATQQKSKQHGFFY